MLYVINEYNTNKYKIGKTINIKKRLSGLQCGNSDDLIIKYLYNTPNDHAYEIQLHDRFENNKVRGEWYTFEDISELINYIQTLDDIEVEYKL